MLAAFFAGLLLAGVGVLLFHHFIVGDRAGPPASLFPAFTRPEAPSSAARPATSPSAAVPPASRSAAKNQASPSAVRREVSPVHNGAAEGGDRRREAHDVAGRRDPRREALDTAPEAADPATEKSVAAALAELRNLPFEEAGTLDAEPPPFQDSPVVDPRAGRPVPYAPAAPNAPAPATPGTDAPASVAPGHETPMSAGRESHVPGPGRAGPAATEPSAAPVPRGRDARLCIVMDDLGAKRQATQRLLALDYPVTLAFWPHGPFTREGAEAAAAAGREVLIHQPMEPVGYPGVRPGPNVLLTGMDPGRIRAALASSLAAVPYASGLNNHMGSRFTRSVAGVDTVIEFLREHGLFMLDSVTHPESVFASEGRRMGLEHYRRDVFLDVERSRAAVLEALRKAESLALRNGKAVAIGHPLPETLDALEHFAETRNKGIRIVRLCDLNR
ncbi:MAG: divergent polysaccharide deacetylase family protein [Desulfovibrio sp.]|nr:divergent polysaccharide deacetylase family protein [Desulfovibrio sp.]